MMKDFFRCILSTLQCFDGAELHFFSISAASAIFFFSFDGLFYEIQYDFKQMYPQQKQMKIWRPLQNSSNVLCVQFGYYERIKPQ